MAAIHGNIPPEDFPSEPGQWQIRRAVGGDNETHIVFGCPSRPGSSCGVPLLPSRLPNGAGWNWDGNTEKPTITPSINCVGGCKWHGFITAGEIK